MYRDLGSEAARLAAVKEQILIGYLGLGWEEAHHAWSKDGVTFISEELLKRIMSFNWQMISKCQRSHL